MNDYAICPRKVTLLKEKIIQVGKLLEQCKENREKYEALEAVHLKTKQTVTSLSDQHLQVLAEKEDLKCTVETLRKELNNYQKTVTEYDLEITQLRQVINVYKTEREEYGRIKIDATELRLQKAFFELMSLCENLKKPGFTFTSLSKSFMHHFKEDIFRFHQRKQCRYVTLPSPARSMASTSSESGFESMICSPYSAIDEETQVNDHAEIVTPLRGDELCDKNDGKRLSMLGEDFARDKIKPTGGVFDSFVAPDVNPFVPDRAGGCAKTPIHVNILKKLLEENGRGANQWRSNQGNRVIGNEKNLDVSPTQQTCPIDISCKNSGDESQQRWKIVTDIRLVEDKLCENLPELSVEPVNSSIFLEKNSNACAQTSLDSSVARKSDEPKISSIFDVPLQNSPISPKSSENINPDFLEDCRKTSHQIEIQPSETMSNVSQHSSILNCSQDSLKLSEEKNPDEIRTVCNESKESNGISMDSEMLQESIPKIPNEVNAVLCDDTKPVQSLIEKSSLNDDADKSGISVTHQLISKQQNDGKIQKPKSCIVEEKPINRARWKYKPIEDSHHLEDNDGLVTDEEIARVFELTAIPMPLSPLPRRKRKRSENKVTLDVGTQMLDHHVECWTQTDQNPLPNQQSRNEHSETVLYKHFKMFMALIGRRKRRKPKPAQWFVAPTDPFKIPKKKTKRLQTQLKLVKRKSMRLSQSVGTESQDVATLTDRLEDDAPNCDSSDAESLFIHESPSSVEPEVTRKSERLTAKRGLRDLFGLSPEKLTEQRHDVESACEPVATLKKRKIDPVDDLFGSDSSIQLDNDTTMPKEKQEEISLGLQVQAIERPFTRSQKPTAQRFSPETMPLQGSKELDEPLKNFREKNKASSEPEKITLCEMSFGHIAESIDATTKPIVLEKNLPLFPKKSENVGEALLNAQHPPAVPTTKPEPEPEPCTDYKKLKTIRKSWGASHQASSIQVPSTPSVPSKFSFNFEDITEKSRMMKMKPAVLSQQCNVPKTPQHEPFVYSAQTSCSLTTGNVFTGILAKMEKPPVVALPRLSTGPIKGLKKKKKKKKKKEMANEKPVNDSPVIPPPKFKTKEEENAWNILDTFLSTQCATNEVAAESLNNCINALSQFSNNILVKTVVKIVLENVDENPDLRFTPPAPPLTPTQQRLFVLFAALKHFPSIYSDLVDEICSILVPDQFFWMDDTVECCAMFLGALYRHMDDCTGAINFCVDVGVQMRQRGCLVINALLAAWPEILPLADGADPWGPGATLALLVMNTPISTRGNQKASLRKLRSLLNSYYGYERQISLPDWTKRAIEALRKGDLEAGSALNAVAPTVESAEATIIAPLLETLGVWEFGGLPDSTAFKIIDILQATLKGFNKKDCLPVTIRTIQRLGEILLAGKVNQTGQEKIVEMISPLSNCNNKFYLILEKWIPVDVVTPHVCEKLIAALTRPRSRVEKKKIKKNVVNSC